MKKGDSEEFVFAETICSLSIHFVFIMLIQPDKQEIDGALVFAVLVFGQIPERFEL